jgi:hypothetical protein
VTFKIAPDEAVNLAELLDAHTSTHFNISNEIILFCDFKKNEYRNEGMNNKEEMVSLVLVQDLKGSIYL